MGRSGSSPKWPGCTTGRRPPNRVPIEIDDHDPAVLICAETTPAFVEKRLE